VQYEILGKITPEPLAEFDADQNISDFKENNNVIRMVYDQMGRFSCSLATRSKSAKDKRKTKKKGAQRAPLTPTESLPATARSRHHKTRPQYRYLLPGVV
jgi:hypothetical protein